MVWMTWEQNRNCCFVQYLIIPVTFMYLSTCTVTIWLGKLKPIDNKVRLEEMKLKVAWASIDWDRNYHLLCVCAPENSCSWKTYSSKSTVAAIDSWQRSLPLYNSPALQVYMSGAYNMLANYHQCLAPPQRSVCHSKTVLRTPLWVNGKHWHMGIFWYLGLSSLLCIIGCWNLAWSIC